ncbi:MAG: 6-pyruvoyltetrahydropterin synthase [Phycisphaerae bacterium]|nr:MAG: 6-pyruvoyltetrahydropterin synthase [Phycisphaerae bacterium]
MPESFHPVRLSGPICLMREIRFSIDRDWARAAHGASGFEGALPVTNSWGGWPSAVGVAPYLKLRIVVSGEPDATTGYLVNIQVLDELLRRYAIPAAARALAVRGVSLTIERLLSEIYADVSGRVPGGCRLESLMLAATPYLSSRIDGRRPGMVELTQSFEFSASHRLHVASLSDEANRRVFGKCNNPNGHGHNYEVRVTVGGELTADRGTVVEVPQFEAVVKREVIDRLDHKHLNSDVAEFAGVNPSVENIARVIWGLLEEPLKPARLLRVRVYETAKTYAEYSGG